MTEVYELRPSFQEKEAGHKGQDNPAFVPDGPTLKTCNKDKNGSIGPPEDSSPTKGNILKNIFTISTGFLFNFTAFNALANIQSSLNSDSGLGAASLSVIYASLIISCMFVPAALINRIGCKWTMVISMLMYSTYIAGNFYASWYTLIPGAILVGLGAAPLWSAKCTYLTETGQRYAGLVHETAEVIVVRFFGIFFMIFQSSQIWGNLISSLVLQQGDDNFVPIDLQICGSNYCNEDLKRQSINTTLNGTDSNANVANVHHVYLLCGIYLGCSLFGVLLIVLLVNPLVRLSTPKQNPPGLQLLIATFRHMKNCKQLLLIPLTIYSGLEQAYIGGDFTKAFVSCSMGIHNVGFVMICLGTVDAIFSFAFGPLLKIVGRPPLYIFGAITNLALIITMLHWRPDPESPAAYYLIAGLWGMADAIWQTQINAFYGILFNENVEAGFANYRLWESIGFIIGYAWNTYLCINVKLYILTAILCMGMCGYLGIEIMLRWKDKSVQKIGALETSNEKVC